MLITLLLDFFGCDKINKYFYFMFEKLKKKVKNYFSQLFNPENRERGAFWIPVLIAISIAGSAGWLCSFALGPKKEFIRAL